MQSVEQRCYQFTNPVNGKRIYYKQNKNNVVVVNEARMELSFKPKNWLADIPTHRERVIPEGTFRNELEKIVKLAQL
jgi:hypothetical protein